MSIQKLREELAFDSFAQEIRPELGANGIELNHMYFDEPSDPACLHIGLDNDYALVQIVFWEGGNLELISIQPADSENSRKSEFVNAGRNKLQEIVRLSIDWLRDRQPVESLHSP
jgi:hypothetical protein